MVRVYASTLAAVALIAVLTGCGPSANEQSMLTACQEARTQLGPIGDLIEEAAAAADQGHDDDESERRFAEELKKRTADLAHDLREPQVSDAFGSVRTALDRFADSITAADASDASVDAAVDTVASSGTDLQQLCDIPAILPNPSPAPPASSE